MQEYPLQINVHIKADSPHRDSRLVWQSFIAFDPNTGGTIRLRSAVEGLEDYCITLDEVTYDYEGRTYLLEIVDLDLFDVLRSNAEITADDIDGYVKHYVSYGFGLI